MTGTAPSTDARSARGDFGSVTWQATPAVPFPEVPALMAQEALEYVATQAGTSIFRDAADDYVVGELRSFGARGATISDETSLGLPNGVGDLPTAATPADVDRDGMADAWERASGLDPIRRQRSQRRS